MRMHLDWLNQKIDLVMEQVESSKTVGQLYWRADSVDRDLRYGIT